MQSQKEKKISFFSTELRSFPFLLLGVQQSFNPFILNFLLISLLVLVLVWVLYWILIFASFILCFPFFYFGLFYVCKLSRERKEACMNTWKFNYHKSREGNLLVFVLISINILFMRFMVFGSWMHKGIHPNAGYN